MAERPSRRPLALLDFAIVASAAVVPVMLGMLLLVAVVRPADPAASVLGARSDRYASVRQVAALQHDGMVESAGAERATGGKPAQLYQITPAAEELFPKAYALVLGEMIRVLEQQQGREAVVRLLRDVGTRTAASHRGAGPDLGARVQQAAAALRGLGGDVEVERRGTEWVIQGYGCPLSAVTSDHACCHGVVIRSG